MRAAGLTPRDFERIDSQLDTVNNFLNEGNGGRSIPTETEPPLPESVDRPADHLRLLGTTLFNKFLPHAVREALEGDKCFLEIGVDEQLNRYPLELMHDGTGYLCLKHRIGRYVVSAQHHVDRPADFSKELSALVVSVPEPDHTVLNVENLSELQKEQFNRTLKRVREEASRITKLLQSVVNELEFVEGNDATWENVTGMLAPGRHFDIIHFCGHAMFDDDDPNSSVLLLRNATLTTADIRGYVPNVKPMFCFINACQSVNAGSVAQPFNLYGGIGEAFLSSGAYLLASRSKIDDKAAAAFAVRFYETLLGEGKSFGEAVLEGRLACQKVEGCPFDWASYIFYGDPRFGFSKASTPGAKRSRRRYTDGD
jgi:CHAT domain-containing protein